MSIERILANRSLVDEIATRLERAKVEDPSRTQLSADRLRAASQGWNAGRESILSRDEEAIIRREGRPVFFVRNGKVEGQLGQFWGNRIEAARAKLERAIPAVGRIELERHPTRDWAGTAWLIAPDVIVTNRHVADLFVHASGDGYVFDTDPHGQRALASVDFRREHGLKTKRCFQIRKVLHIEPALGGRPDVALFQVSRTGDDHPDELAPAIRLSETDPEEGAVIGAIGYPARDDMRNDASVMEEIFAGVYRVKRFQPGEVTSSKSAYLNHDCSTLGGNSGSVLVDFSTGQAVGLHYAGYYERENFAVKASTLAEILHKLKVDFARAEPRPVSGVNRERPPELHLTRQHQVEPATASALDSVLGSTLESAQTTDHELMTPEQVRELVRLLGDAREKLRAEELHGSDLGSSPEDEVAARLQAWLHMNAEYRARVEGLDGEVKFDNLDLRWGFSLLSWLRGVKKHPMLRPSLGAEALPNVAKIAILGDWGSGLYGAPEVAKSVAEGKYQLAVHLGDVYYAGTESEVRNNFLKHWPKDQNMVSRALNSNHEMYAGGYGYFGLTLPAFRQQGSYFAMQNDHFLLVGLDTGYTDHDLDEEQLDWLERTVGAAGARRLILLSHHQLFMPGRPAEEKLAQRLKRLLEQKRIFAWYWGHEHAAVVFSGPDPRWGFYPRCVGHGGFPYFRYRGSEPTEPGLNDSRWRLLPAAHGTPSARLLDDPNPYVAPKAKPERYGAQGYASLLLDGAALTERLHRPDGTLVYQSKLLAG